MKSDTEKKLDIRLFTGYQVNSELKMHLAQSSIWKLTKIIPDHEKKELMVAHYQGKDYLGTYLKNATTTLKELSQVNQRLITQLNHYCPEMECDHLKTYMFAQMFIGA